MENHPTMWKDPQGHSHGAGYCRILLAVGKEVSFPQLVRPTCNNNQTGAFDDIVKAFTSPLKKGGFRHVS